MSNCVEICEVSNSHKLNQVKNPDIMYPSIMRKMQKGKGKNVTISRTLYS